MFMEYKDEAPEAKDSFKLVMDGLTIFDRPLTPTEPNLFGEGNGLSLSASFADLSFGFENSFIFDFSDFSLCSFSGGGNSKFTNPGESLLGYAAFAAVVAAAELLPTCPL